jgi:hypothetical protein
VLLSIVRRFLIITLCLFGVGVLALLLMRQARVPAPGMPAAADPEPEVAEEPQPEPVAEQPEPVAEPEPDHAADDVVAPPAAEDGERLLAELAQIRAEVAERVERRPLFMMAEQRGVPYFRLFFMTKQELLEAILEAEGVPPADVRPSAASAARVREVAAEAYRRDQEIAAEEAAEVGTGTS